MEGNMQKYPKDYFDAVTERKRRVSEDYIKRCLAENNTSEDKWIELCAIACSRRIIIGRGKYSFYLCWVVQGFAAHAIRIIQNDLRIKMGIYSYLEGNKLKFYGKDYDKMLDKIKDHCPWIHNIATSIELELLECLTT